MLNDLYNKILYFKRASGMSLVDNQDFLHWSVNFLAENPDEENQPPKPADPETAMKLSSAEGATPLETIEALESALDAVF